MKSLSQICHAVLVLGMFLSLESRAQSLACASLFQSKKPIVLNPMEQTKSEIVMSELIDLGILNEIRTSNTSNQHIPFFAAQLDPLSVKLAIRYEEAYLGLSKPDKLSKGKNVVAKVEKNRKQLSEMLKKIYDQMLEESSVRIQTKTVTYEWYMEYFLKAIVFSDVAFRLSEPNVTPQHFEQLRRKLMPVTGESAVVSENYADLLLFGTMKKTHGMPSQYFRNYVTEHPLIPILFVPKPSDVIEAEKYGMSFVSIAPIKTKTFDGKFYPMDFAAKQVEQSLQEVTMFKDLLRNTRTKWLRNHAKIASRIHGKQNLEELYMYLITEVTLQKQFTERLEIGYRIFVPINAHEMSNYLKKYFEIHESELKKRFDEKTLEQFIETIYQIEKEALA